MTTIIRKGRPHINEGIAASVLRPGLFIVGVPRTQDRNGTATLPSAGGFANGVVLENEIESNGVGGSFASGVNIIWGVFKSGDMVWGRVAANAVNINAGTALRVLADGTVGAATIGTDHVIGFAAQTLNNSANPAEAFIDIEIA